MRSNDVAQAEKVNSQERAMPDDSVKVPTQKRKLLLLTISVAALIAIAFGLGFGLRDDN
jgi:hypothetical protein